MILKYQNFSRYLGLTRGSHTHVTVHVHLFVLHCVDPKIIVPQGCKADNTEEDVCEEQAANEGHDDLAKEWFTELRENDVDHKGEEKEDVRDRRADRIGCKRP